MRARYLQEGDIAMRTGRPKADLVLSSEERAQLLSFVRSRSLPAALSNRARIVLSSADGEANNSIAQRLKIHKRPSASGGVAISSVASLVCTTKYGRARRARSTTSAWRS
jgi:hypothetical protein